MTLGIVFAYLVVVILIGVLSQRQAMRSSAGAGEDYFVAGRTIGPFVLLMTLFGTHMTSFALLGSSAESYRVGIGVFTLMASSSALMAPLLFLFIGTRVWRIGKRHGYLTQVQFLRARFESDLFGLLLFAVLVILIIPYLLIGVMGGGITLAYITEANVPQWFGSALICFVVLFYVSFGGMRGTAWVNTFQTSLFMVLGAVTGVVIVRSLGGLTPSMEQIEVIAPELLVRGERLSPTRVLTYTFVPLSVGMFPHIFTHWLSAREVGTFKAPVILYPLCIAAVWVPMVILGVFGHLDFPELAGPATNNVLVMQIAEHAPGVLGGLLGAGVFAAIMSSLDSQSLSLGTMFTQDIVRNYGLVASEELDRGRDVFVGRVFIAAIIILTFLLSLVAQRSIFGLAVWSFSGFSALLPILIAALYWRRATAAGAMASLLVVIGLWGYFFSRGFGKPDYSVLGLGVMPVAVLFVTSGITMVVVSLLTRAPSEETLAKFFAPRGRAPGGAA